MRRNSKVFDPYYFVGLVVIINGTYAGNDPDSNRTVELSIITTEVV